MVVMDLYRINWIKNLQKPQAGDDSDVDDDFNGGEDGLPDYGFPSSENEFLDPRYCVLDLLTPTATQNRLSYLVELLLDKSKKRISNEALKKRLRKDPAAFGTKNMPIDVHTIGRFLGVWSLQEVTRHRCGGDEYFYAWIGVIDEWQDEFNDVCRDCGHPRYVLDRGKLRPRRVFYYFGAANDIEALYRHPLS